MWSVLGLGAMVGGALLLAWLAHLDRAAGGPPERHSPSDRDLLTSFRMAVNSGERLEKLKLLTAGHPLTLEARLAAEEALTDADPHLRLVGAAETQGPQAYACLVALVQTDTGVPSELRAEALAKDDILISY